MSDNQFTARKATKQETKKEETKTTKKDHSQAKASFVRGILGLVLLLVFGSIAYSTVVIVGGTEGLTPKIMVAPMALFDIFIAFVAFSKILK